MPHDVSVRLAVKMCRSQKNDLSCSGQEQVEVKQSLDRAVESGSIYHFNQLSSFYNLNDRVHLAV